MTVTTQVREIEWCSFSDAESRVNEAIHILDALRMLLEDAMLCLSNCDDDNVCLDAHDDVERARRMVINTKKYLELIKEKYFNDS